QQSGGQYLRCLVITARRYRIVRERDHNPAPSSRCIDREPNALLQDSVEDARQSGLPFELLSANRQSARNNGKSLRTLTRAVHEQGQNPGRVLWPAGKAALLLCNPPTMCRGFAIFGSLAGKRHTLPGSG